MVPCNFDRRRGLLQDVKIVRSHHATVIELLYLA
jgi:hypothetical protein